MADALDRLAAVCAPWTTATLSLIEIAPPALIDLRGPAGDVAFKGVVAGVLGIEPPLAANRFVTKGDITLAWLGPDEWLIMAPAGDEARLCVALEIALAGHHHAVTDVSGNRAVFRLSGSGARDLLSAGSPFDFHPRSFAVGDCTQTVLARTGAIILQREDISYDILVRRSFARYLWQWLGTAARIAG